MKYKLLISLGAFLVLVLGVGGTIAWQRGFFAKADADHPTQFIQHDFVDLTKIGAISKFRSGSGHDFSGGGETCRSMKHYFTPAYTAADMKALEAQPETQGRRLPPAPTADTAIAIYAPVDGQITGMQSEHFPVGQQVFITPDAAKGYVIRIFHVYPVDGLKKGSHVTAGQHIGDISRLSATDISVQAGQLNGKYVSYFDVMPDNIFSVYQALGIQSRSDILFSKEFRDAHPFQCNGEEFGQNYEGDDQEIKINGWVNPQGQQVSSPNGQTNVNNARDVTIYLFNDATSATIAQQHVNVTSGNGQLWNSETDSSGSFVLPASSVDQEMRLMISGYEATSVPYQQALTGTLTLRLKTSS